MIKNERKSAQVKYIWLGPCIRFCSVFLSPLETSLPTFWKKGAPSLQHVTYIGPEKVSGFSLFGPGALKWKPNFFKRYGHVAIDVLTNLERI